MEAEASLFESSEILAAFLGSTTLLAESWELCRQANATATAAPGKGFVGRRSGEVSYVAFSSSRVQSLIGGWFDPITCTNLVPLDATTTVSHPIIFSSLIHRQSTDGTTTKEQPPPPPPPPMVHAGFLSLFLSLYNCPNFQNQIFEVMKDSKSIVLTGHSIGGAIASLAALWLIPYLRSLSSPLSVLCITFGSPLLGNESLSRLILHERWGGQFWHVVTNHDIVPRLLLAPLGLLTFTPQLQSLLRFFHTSMASPHIKDLNNVPLSEREVSELFHFVVDHTAEFAKGERGVEKASGSFWPFGSYMFCGKEGAISVDNAVAVVRLLHLLFAMGSPSRCVEDHVGYGDIIGNVSRQFMKRRDCVHLELLPKSSYEVGIAMALQSSGIAAHESKAVEPARECLKMAKRLGRRPNLISANLAIGLSKIAPLRAQVEWYKAKCDESSDQMGYYDTFKQGRPSIRDSRVNLNRIKLARFWDDLIQQIETNQLPHDFQRREKWVYASLSYKLLVEPLDIAEYYRSGKHRRNGHYVSHGRERRYEVFDRWWRERKEGVKEEEIKRTKYASLTQDSCFWGRVEEAREWLDSVRSERDGMRVCVLWENIERFEKYAKEMVERKEVSIDVVAKNSSYSLWVEELKGLRSQLNNQHIPPPHQFHGFLGGEIVP